MRREKELEELEKDPICSKLIYGLVETAQSRAEELRLGPKKTAERVRRSALWCLKNWRLGHVPFIQKTFPEVDIQEVVEQGVMRWLKIGDVNSAMSIMAQFSGVDWKQFTQVEGPYGKDHKHLSLQEKMWLILKHGDKKIDFTELIKNAYDFCLTNDNPYAADQIKFALGYDIFFEPTPEFLKKIRNIEMRKPVRTKKLDRDFGGGD